jgi:hypothetical protein
MTCGDTQHINTHMQVGTVSIMTIGNQIKRAHMSVPRTGRPWRRSACVRAYMPFLDHSAGRCMRTESCGRRGVQRAGTIQWVSKIAGMWDVRGGEHLIDGIEQSTCGPSLPRHVLDASVCSYSDLAAWQ